MAMIVEVLDRAGEVSTRVRLGGQPLTVGRGYDNDLILDDVYVDARHARIHVGEDGSVVVEDLGSINGLVVVGETRGSAPASQVTARPGTRVKLGRTTLRFRDPGEPVPPALPASADSTRVESWLTTVTGRVVAAVAAVVAVAMFNWFSSYVRDSGSDTLSTVLAVVLMLAMWCGIWAIAGRVVIQRFNFTAHYAVASMFAVVALVFTWFGTWMAFLFPGASFLAVLAWVPWALLVAAGIAFHLGLSSNMDRFRRWRAGAITVGVLVGIIGLSALAETDTFTDVPEFNGLLKYMHSGWLPASGVADFGDVVADLKQQVDELATE